MKAGDRVNWLHSPRGGYGYVVPVAGVVRSVTARRVKIDIAIKIEGKWVVESRTVTSEKLTPRTVAVAALGESDEPAHLKDLK